MNAFLIIDGAPTIQECFDSIANPSAYSHHWTTWETIVQLGRPSASPEANNTSVDSRFEDAESQVLKVLEVTPVVLEEEEEEVRRESLFDDDESFVEESWRIHQEEENQEGEDSRGDTSSIPGATQSRILAPPTSSLHPPPSSLVSQRHSPVPFLASGISASTSMEDNTTWTSNGGSEESFLGRPPFLPWSAKDVVPLSRIREKIDGAKGRGAYAHPVVDLLARVRKVTSINKWAPGKAVATWSLVDGSGGEMNFVMWDSYAHDWSTQARGGDVVHLSDVTVKVNKESVPEATPHASRGPTLQVCYRTVQTSPEDAEYVFHAGFGSISNEAHAVLVIAGVIRS